MEKILLKSPTLIHPESPYNNQEIDILIVDGKIAEVGETLNPAEGITVIDCVGKYVSPGFFDLNTNFGEPGYETREDLQSGCQAAAAGGFTGVAVHPNTQPPVHSKSEVSYIINKTAANLVDVYPVGCISQKREGVDLAELYDMKKAGAIAFSDGNKPVSDSGLMSRALLYAKGIDALVFSFAEDVAIAGKGKMNEGAISTILGMKGIPALAEELMISRDLYLAEYNESKIHFSTISTAHSVDLIRNAKKKGLQVTCDVAAHHLVLTDAELQGFDSNFKVKPPLRTEADIIALKAGLADGTIDAVVSQHTPYEIEHKNVEFEIASFGIIALQTVLPLLVQADLTASTIVEKLSINPRRILSIEIPSIQQGEVANLVLFDLKKEWVLDEQTNYSQSSNSPFFEQKLTGGIVLTINNHQIHLN